MMKQKRMNKSASISQMRRAKPTVFYLFQKLGTLNAWKGLSRAQQPLVELAGCHLTASHNRHEPQCRASFFLGGGEGLKVQPAGHQRSFTHTHNIITIIKIILFTRNVVFIVSDEKPQFSFLFT